MSYSWYRFHQPSMYFPHFYYASDIAHLVPQAAQAATQAASAAPLATTPALGNVNAALHTAQSAFIHPPHLPPSYLGQPSPFVAEFGRGCRRGYHRGGPRIFPWLVVGGLAVWSIHRIRGLEDDMARETRRQRLRELELSSAVVAAPVPEEKPQPQGRGWGRGRLEPEQWSSVNEKMV